MFRYRYHLFAIAVTVVGLGLRAATAGEPQIKPGDEVVALKDHELKVRSTTVGEVRGGDRLIVEQTQGTWLWVRKGNIAGWIEKTAVKEVLAPPDERSPSVALPSAVDKRVAAIVGPEEQRLGRMPIFILDGALSSDGCHLALLTRQVLGNQVAVVVDGTQGSAYESVGQGSIVFSPDGNRLGYAARKGQTWCVIVEGQEGPGFEHIVKGSLLFSADGKRVAYVARKNQRWITVVDGEESPSYEAISYRALVLGPHGGSAAFVAGRGEKSVVVVDGQEGPFHDGIAEGTPVLSPDGKRVAYGHGRTRSGLWLWMGKKDRPMMQLHGVRLGLARTENG